MNNHSLSHVRQHYVFCSCGRRFGPGPYKVKALNAHIKDERDES